MDLKLLVDFDAIKLSTFLPSGTYQRDFSLLAFSGILPTYQPSGTGSHCMGVDFIVPLIIHISVFRTVSKCFVWLLSAQTGEQYSAAEYTRARLAV